MLHKKMGYQWGPEKGASIKKGALVGAGKGGSIKKGAPLGIGSIKKGALVGGGRKGGRERRPPSKRGHQCSRLSHLAAKASLSDDESMALLLSTVAKVVPYTTHTPVGVSGARVFTDIHTHCRLCTKRYTHTWRRELRQRDGNVIAHKCIHIIYSLVCWRYGPLMRWSRVDNLEPLLLPRRAITCFTSIIKKVVTLHKVCDFQDSRVLDQGDSRAYRVRMNG